MEEGKGQTSRERTELSRGTAIGAEPHGGAECGRDFRAADGGEKGDTPAGTEDWAGQTARQPHACRLQQALAGW